MTRLQKNTVDPRGRTLEELSHIDTAGSKFAQQKAQQFAAILTTEGNQFVRISSDWGRLQAVGRPLANNDLQWSAEALGPILNSFDVALTRSLYRRILPQAYNISHYRYASPGVHAAGGLEPEKSGCKFYDFLAYQSQDNQSPSAQNTFYPFAYWPGAPIDGLSYPIADTANTQSFDLWQDIWVMYPSQSGVPGCTDTGSTSPRSFYTSTGIFDRLDPSDQTRLGMYKPYFFQRSGIPVLQVDDPGDAASFWQNHQNVNLNFGNGPASLDPVSY